jgi:mannose-6-phosphate isomerase-like protein (cupin superfamily)
MQDGQRPFVVGPSEGRFIDLGKFGMTLKADADETAGVVSVLEAEEPPGFGPPIHVHHDLAEAFYVLAGDYIMYLERSYPAAASRVSASRIRAVAPTER